MFCRLLMSCFLPTLLLLNFGCRPAPGSSTPSGAIPSVTNETAPPVTTDNEFVRKVAAFYKTMKSAQVDIAETTSAMPITRQLQLTIERPDKLAVRDTAQQGVDVILDGQATYTVWKPLKKYLTGPSPGNFDELANNLSPLSASGWGVMFAPALFCNDPFQAIMTGVTAVTDAGQETLDNVPVHHLKFAQADMNWEMWVAAKGDPLVMKLVFQQGAAAGAITSTAVYTNWKANPQIPANTLAFQPPSDFEKVDNFQDVLGELGKLLGGQPAEQTSPLVGKTAPDIEGKLMDGAAFSMKEKYANQILMIDFWATWCGPCVTELPILMKVADEYKEKGVALYAINQGEDVETIKTFLEEKGWKLNVVMDPDNKHGSAYGVQGIPQLVICDKQGIVQKVHVGYHSGIEAQLKQELDAILGADKAEK